MASKQQQLSWRVKHMVLNCRLACVLLVQENVKARHPQLLYESKLYKILQGGGGCEARTTV